MCACREPPGFCNWIKVESLARMLAVVPKQNQNVSNMCYKKMNNKVIPCYYIMYHEYNILHLDPSYKIREPPHTQSHLKSLESAICKC